MFYTAPWHRLGAHVPDTPDSEAALTAASLAWAVESQPVYPADDRRPRLPRQPPRHGWSRPGVVADASRVVPNREAFALAALLGESPALRRPPSLADGRARPHGRVSEGPPGLWPTVRGCRRPCRARQSGRPRRRAGRPCALSSTGRSVVVAKAGGGQRHGLDREPPGHRRVAPPVRATPRRQVSVSHGAYGCSRRRGGTTSFPWRRSITAPSRWDPEPEHPLRGQSNTETGA